MGDVEAQNPIKPAMGNQVKTPNQNAPLSAHSQKAECPSEIAFDESQLQEAAATNSPTGNTLGNLISCPYCSSKKVWRNAKRYTKSGGEVQRWLCRNCGYRFSESQPLKNSLDWSLNTGSATICKRQVCAQKDAKNLDTATKTKIVASDRKIDKATAKGLLLQFALWLQKEGCGENCRYKDSIRMLINSGADIYNPENVKEVVARKGWKNGTKMQAVYAYSALARMLKMTWDPPRYRQEEAFPFIPEEKEIDALILGSNSKRMAAYLQCLKETMADPSEA
jgi:hypothetical protein